MEGPGFGAGNTLLILGLETSCDETAAALVVLRQLEEPFEQGGGDASPLVVGIDRDVHHVPGVDVARDDEVAEELGFRPRGVRRGYYTDNREDALIMWKDPISESADEG